MLRILNEDPTDEQFQTLINLYNGGALDKALEMVQMLLQQFPDSARIYNFQGAINASLENFDLAIQSYLEALRIKPDYAQAYNNIGVSLRTCGQLEPAIQSYKQALMIKPAYAQALNNLGIALQENGELEEAERNFKKALEIEPYYAEAYYNLGLALQDKNNLEAAKFNYLKALEIEPSYAEAHYNLGIIFLNEGENANAIMCLKNTLVFKKDSAEARHLINALTGNTTNAPPTGYVEKLFDHYAGNFEKSLIDKLDYQTPRMLTEIIREHSQSSLGSVLDLGCGTGLIGKEIGKYCSNLHGVDLSKPMLDQAKKKNIYDKLSHYNLADFLSTETLNFDYFIAADVFVYIGELLEIFRLIKFRNSKNGRLVFSTEHTEKDGYCLENSGRYSHSRNYIDNLCRELGYRICHFSTSNIRKEKNGAICGGLYLLEF